MAVRTQPVIAASSMPGSDEPGWAGAAQTPNIEGHNRQSWLVFKTCILRIGQSCSSSGMMPKIRVGRMWGYDGSAHAPNPRSCR
jgi:hypothetical protein